MNYIVANGVITPIECDHRLLESRAMKVATLPDNEEERIRKLQELGILDTIEEQSYDDITQLAAQLIGTPISLVSLVDKGRQWFKSHHGLDARETARDIAFCSHAILKDEVFIVEDSRKDERFKDNPLVTGDPEVIFYAGAPLKLGEDLRLGTLCVIGNEPKSISQEQVAALEALARQVVSQFTLRLLIKRIRRLSHSQDGFISTICDELKIPLTAIYGSLSVLLNDSSLVTPEDYKKFVEISHRNSEQLLSASNDIIDIARIDTEEHPIDFEALSVVPLVELTIDHSQEFCKKQGFNLIFDKSDYVREKFVIDGSEQQLLLMLNKLITISVKIANSERPINLSIDTNDTKVKISVTHHSTNIAKDQVQSLFQNFDTLWKETGERLSGISLSLIICKQIAELHNGEIGFESIENDGSAFYLTLPLQNT